MMTEKEVKRELAAGNPVCPECCDAVMELEYDSRGDRVFVCPECGFDIEEDVYGHPTFDQYASNYGYVHMHQDDYDYEDEPDEGCIACGAPFPQCKASCSRFDD